MDYATAADVLVGIGRWLDAKSLAPAGGGNYSVRLDDGTFAITVSGRHKGRLRAEDIMRVDAAGRPLVPKKPSAETLLHMKVYARVPTAGVVLHTHSVASVTLLRHAPHLRAFRLAGYELLKAYPGINTHEVELDVPVFDNTQDMVALAEAISPGLGAPTHAPGFLVRDHGLYGWAGDVESALCVVEATEYLLACELELAKLGPAGGASKTRLSSLSDKR